MAHFGRCYLRATFWDDWSSRLNEWTASLKNTAERRNAAVDRETHSELTYAGNIRVLNDLIDRARQETANDEQDEHTVDFVKQGMAKLSSELKPSGSN